jgi:hypothetical protein
VPTGESLTMDEKEKKQAFVLLFDTHSISKYLLLAPKAMIYIVSFAYQQL